MVTGSACLQAIADQEQLRSSARSGTQRVFRKGPEGGRRESKKTGVCVAGRLPNTRLTAKARLTVVHDLPTPPFADDTRITCLTPGIGSLLGSLPDLAAMLKHRWNMLQLITVPAAGVWSDVAAAVLLLAPCAVPRASLAACLRRLRRLSSRNVQLLCVILSLMQLERQSLLLWSAIEKLSAIVRPLLLIFVGKRCLLFKLLASLFRLPCCPSCLMKW